MTEWIKQLFETIDRMDADGFVTFLTDDATFQFGNAPAIQGRDNIRKGVADFYKAISGLKHTIDNTWESGNAVICQGQVTYTRLDDKTVTIPFVNIFRMKGSLAHEYFIYIDLAPLFA